MKFKNQKPPADQQDHPLIKTIGDTYVKYKQQIADCLQTQSDKFSVRLKKIALIMFGLIVSGISLGFIVGSLTSSATLKFVQQSLPHTNTSGAPLEDPLLTEEEYRHLHHLMFRLDSLNRKKDSTRSPSD